MVATDEWAFARVHSNHKRDGKRFHQRGVEVYRLNADGPITVFWAFMRDTVALDGFFACAANDRLADIRRYADSACW